MKKTIAVLPGDGIGPEVIEQAIKVLMRVSKKYNHVFVFKYGYIGGAAIEKIGNALPEETVALCKSADAILFGAIGDPKYDNDKTITLLPEQSLLKLRRTLDLYTNVRPIKPFASHYDKSPIKKEIIKGTDFVVIRELTGGIYFGKKGRSKNGKQAFDTCEYTTREITRVTKFAFKLALRRHSGLSRIDSGVADTPQNDRPKVTLVDKANVLETSRLWRETVQQLGKQYSNVTIEFMYVDNASMQIIKRPSTFDVIVTDNMFGDILTDEASVITGSIGLVPSASIGTKTSLYEPIHGSYPKAAGQNTANPIGAILSAAMLLDYSFGLKKEAKAIERAVEAALKAGIGTKDIIEKNPHSTSMVGDEIAALI